MSRINLVISLLVSILFGCTSSEKNAATDDKDSISGPSYAVGFQIFEQKSVRKLLIHSPWNENSLLSSFIIWPDSIPLPDSLKSSQVIFTPVKRLITLSSTQWAAALKLNNIGVIKGISEASYIQNTQIRDRLKANESIEVAVNGTYKPELIIQINPDLVLYSPDPSGIPDVLSRSGSTLLAWPDYYENHPLGRAEWIKVMGLLLQKEDEANKLFDSITHSYNHLKKLTVTIVERPTIFADKEFSGQWYVPGGKSYMACLFHDSGADYIWADNPSTASFPLGIETILNRAHEANYWRIAQAATRDYGYDDLKGENEIYASFKAFQQKKIIFCNTSQTAYFERSQFEPQIVLSDLIFLMHPGLLPNYQPVYYHFLQ
ncbi:MAG: ABC transporter substrate-binding protein [Bacteroidales bacterium]|nr:ABC transporter substrate-binding protein [Bacteroidales bacterium]